MILRQRESAGKAVGVNVAAPMGVQWCRGLDRHRAVAPGSSLPSSRLVVGDERRQPSSSGIALA